MRIYVRGIVFAALLIAGFAFGASAAQASTLLAPKDNASFAGGDTVKFAWNWPDANQPWESRVVYSHESDATGTDWYDAAKIIQLPRIEDTSVLVQLDSHFTKGKWYWRVCNYLILSDDDLCHYPDTEIRSFTMKNTAIADLTKETGRKYVLKAIKRKSSSGVQVSGCRLTAKNVVECVGKWRAGGRNYTALRCTATRNLKTSKTRTRISSVRSEAR